MSALALNLIKQAKLSRAIFLDLGNCGLMELPDDLTKLIWLERLNLGDYYYDEDKKRYTISANRGRNNNLDSSSLTKLTQLPNLQSLNLWDTQVSDIQVLAQLPNLQSLDLSGTKVSDIQGLAQLPNLQSLDLSGTKVSDIQGLAQLPNLQSLNLRGTKVSDISPLRSLIEAGIEVKWSDSYWGNNSIYIRSCLGIVKG
ncbi:hypothetical protein HNV11_19905 [Spirosoma taeanense]|uniref:Leucine-rich repeat domain-containing protein n=1 Tax=Spirosoma taeanense TaxID=2735870 RepID=A0A6M5YER7_9BACT|nr:leucine-rich repeat domain-containing protein [Spirosoma taeanense]QJW91482.1 hypothetical protein HNV11_19905 [Spirosoma taeanense]